MIRARFSLLLFFVAIAAYGQHAQTSLGLTVSENDRISVVRSSVRLAEWHEKSFWPIYEKYMADAVRGYSLTYRSLKDLTATDGATGESEAFENGRKFLNYRNQEVTLRKKYYQEMGGALNGVVALQFLQTEAVMDMIESSDIYTRSAWKNFRFQGSALQEDQREKAKHNVLASALSLTGDKEIAFWNVYNRFQDECNALMGEEYSLYTLFSIDAEDFTPGLAKRLGHDLLHVMEREVKLKEKYFLEMNAAVGPTLAARFLAWEDYYSVVAKMHAWAETR
jgi:hypothetical protein